MDVENRIASLEGQLRLHRRLGLVAACLVAAAFVVRAALPGGKIVEAQKFLLKDASGKTRGRWGIVKGKANLALQDENGRNRVELTAAEKGSLLAFKDMRGRWRVGVGILKGISKHWASGIVFRDEKGESRAIFTLLGERTPNIVFYDEAGKVTWSAP